MTTDATGLKSRDVYQRRFAGDAAFRNAMWQVLCREVFQRHVPAEATVLEIAAGHCEFINNIAASRRIAVDINDGIREYADEGVEVVIGTSTDLSAISAGAVDTVFVSNFFEHITKPDITRTVEESLRVLKDGGRLLVLQPNIRFTSRDYWMFYDHITPLDDRSICEVLETCGFQIESCRPRFLPYTTKGRLPRSIALLRLYLKIPFLQSIVGGQAYVVARKQS